MPTLAAGLVASIAGWVIDGVFRSYLGTGVTLVISLAGSTVVFFVVRNWLVDLRGR